ncbi:methyl-accepting chemotaxis protein [Xylophilus sp. GOD-11R]|uniref:methyl-accepting chemotaxis protein n=1 Tax=Xylophilus sp. GOD-11R TaxID=3089814 RepID=UPI00298C202A|nr:methyl-accepting chemotaxis protein [Xylophilus sp. GOD-11R]WPB57893.1 methyl-accepting chemotaxis protein [Xylophilus sp. GOD-11R]
MTLITILLGVLAWGQLATLHTASEDISTNWLPSVDALSNMRVAANRLRRTESETFLPPSAEVGDKYKAELGRRNQALAAAEAVYAPLVTAGEESRLYDVYKSRRDAYYSQQQKLLALPSSDRAAASDLFLGTSEQAFDAMTDTLGELAAVNREGSTRAQQTGRAVYASAQWILLALTGAAAVIAICMSVWITRLITGPIGRAVQIAQGVAGGDLTMDIEVAGRDEPAQLMQALSQMRISLAAVVGNVRGNAEGVATASAEIAQGNQDLSGRTEQQASALEQTAASMEELGSTVRHNADNARQAAELAANASSVAQRSGEDVGAMVATMRTIDQASRSIGEITGVIDSIAFQTNILALNAAVEAARAGEQGRGFAVVATEVRSLAKRSADAAKEIKSLIDTSGARVREGSEQADRAGASMRQVQESIRQVASIVAEISTATREQSDGISQVGEAVTQMDQVTQQNAALVEESAAAASALKQQAEQLVMAVSVFRIGAMEPLAGHRAHPAANQHSAPRAPDTTAGLLGRQGRLGAIPAEQDWSAA